MSPVSGIRCVMSCAYIVPSAELYTSVCCCRCITPQQGLGGVKEFGPVLECRDSFHTCMVTDC